MMITLYILGILFALALAMAGIDWRTRSRKTYIWFIIAFVFALFCVAILLEEKLFIVRSPIIIKPEEVVFPKPPLVSSHAIIIKNRSHDVLQETWVNFKFSPKSVSRKNTFYIKYRSLQKESSNTIETDYGSIIFAETTNEYTHRCGLYVRLPLIVPGEGYEFSFSVRPESPRVTTANDIRIVASLPISPQKLKNSAVGVISYSDQQAYIIRWPFIRDDWPVDWYMPNGTGEIINVTEQVMIRGNVDKISKEELMREYAEMRATRVVGAIGGQLSPDLNSEGWRRYAGALTEEELSDFSSEFGIIISNICSPLSIGIEEAVDFAQVIESIKDGSFTGTAYSIYYTKKGKIISNIHGSEGLSTKTNSAIGPMN